MVKISLEPPQELIDDTPALPFRSLVRRGTQAMPKSRRVAVAKRGMARLVDAGKQHKRTKCE